MEGAISLVILCLYKLIAWCFYTIGYAFKLFNSVIKISFWSLDMIHDLSKVLIYLVTQPFTLNKKLVYAWGFCGSQRDKLINKLRDRRMHT